MDDQKQVIKTVLKLTNNHTKFKFIQVYTVRMIFITMNFEKIGDFVLLRLKSINHRQGLSGQQKYASDNTESFLWIFFISCLTRWPKRFPALLWKAGLPV